MVYMTTEKKQDLVKDLIDRLPAKMITKKYGKTLKQIIKLGEDMGGDCDYLKDDLPAGGRRSLSTAISKAKQTCNMPPRGLNPLFDKIMDQLDIKGAPIDIDVDLIVNVRSVGVKFDFPAIKFISSTK